MPPALSAAFRGLRDAAALAAQRTGGRRGRIAGTCFGALSGGRHFMFGAVAGYVLGSLLDAFFERRAALNRAHTDGEAAGAEERDRLYALFGLDPDAPPEELKRAYRRLCRDMHPDRAGGSEEGFRALKAAYDRLAGPR